jgi:hypothetical protein
LWHRHQPARFAHFEYKLQLISVSGYTTLIWSVPNAVLEKAEAVEGPWTQVQGPPNPFVISPSGSAGFFRLHPAGP